jgi:hypothetical protein
MTAAAGLRLGEQSSLQNSGRFRNQIGHALAVRLCATLLAGMVGRPCGWPIVELTAVSHSPEQQRLRWRRAEAFVPGSACVACLQTSTCCTQLDICSLGFICTGHGSNASIGFDALRKLLVDLNHRITDLVNLIALPRNGQEQLPAPAPPSHDGTPSETGRETPPP